MKYIEFWVILPALAVAVSPLAAQAKTQAPHSAKTHKGESVYQDGPVVTLATAIRKALEHSPRLKAVEAGSLASSGAEEQASYRPNPQINLQSENIGGTGPYSGTQAAETTLSVNQQIEIAGKRSARMQAANAARKGAQVALMAEKLNIERDVHIAYANVLAEAEALQLAQEQEGLAKSVLASVDKRIDAAVEPAVMGSKAEVAYHTSVMARQQQERALQAAKDRLVRLWGQEELDVSLDHEHFFELDAPDALKDYRKKLTQLPDIQQLAFMQAEKKSQWELERAQAIPDPYVSLSVRDFALTNDQALVVGVTMPIPVFNSNRGNIDKAREEYTQMEHNSAQAKLLLGQQLTQYWGMWDASHKAALRLQKQLLPTAEKAFRQARNGYEAGRFTYLDVLDAQRTLFDARAQYYTLLKQYHEARAYVERLTTPLEELS